MEKFEPRRELGRTGFRATRLGIGDVADRSLPLETCTATLRRALDAGLNIVDTAPAYEDGFSEQIVGTAVQGVRDRVFVIDKIERFNSPVGPQVDESLNRLGMAYADAFVFHNLSDREAFASLTQPGGGFDQLTECIRAGKCRFRGISSHNPDVLYAAIRRGVCDIAMFPVGPFVDEPYVTGILPLAKANGVGTVCFKTFGGGKLVGDTEGYNQPLASGESGLPRIGVPECVHYTLTLDPDVALLGLSSPGEQDEAFAAAREFAALTSEEMQAVRLRAAAARRNKGPCWWNPEPDA